MYRSNILSFQQNQDALLQNFLDQNLFKKQFQNSCFIPEEIRNRKVRPGDLEDGLNIELIVRPDCNLHCEYCYIARYGHKLYPFEQRVSNEEILANCEAVLDWVYNQHNQFIGDWELFAGDMFYDGLYFDILDIFYEYMSNLSALYKKQYNEKNEPVNIFAPVNFTFITNDEQVQKFDEYYNKFIKIGVRLGFSCSIDGYYCTDTRERKTLDDEYYDKLFKFLQKYHMRCHPMVAPSNIHNWKENYFWWKEQYKKYFRENAIDILPMMLEVRNDEWTQERIDNLLAFYDVMIDDRLNDFCQGDIDNFARHIFCGDGKNDTLPRLGSYDPIQPFGNENQERLGCGISGLLHITLNNLSIVPCHRTSYQQFTSGYLTKDETGHINGVHGENVSLMLAIYHLVQNSLPRCCNCKYKLPCLKGCLGAQYETNGELFQPCISVCNMFQQKFNHLINKYQELGVIESAKKQELLTQSQEHFIDMILKEHCNDGKCG